MREAKCHCGQLSLACEGEPHFVALCHCGACQRRTGTSSSLGAWFDASAVRIAGPDRVFSRVGEDTGAALDFHFCPSCGTTIYWTSPGGALPDMLGVAVGCFDDPGFPGPSLSVYTEHRPEWLPPIAGVRSHRRSIDSERG